MTALLTLRTRLRQRLGVPTSDDFFTDAVLTDLVNQAVATVEEEHYWPWAQRSAVGTTTAGVVSKPTLWRATRAVFYGTTELGLVSITDYANTASATGAPSVWTDLGNDIGVSPRPADGTSLTHYYYVEPALLVADTDEPDMPDSATGAVIAKAAELAFAREDNNAGRQAASDDYTKWLARLEHSQRRSTGPLRVRVRPGGWI